MNLIAALQYIHVNFQLVWKGDESCFSVYVCHHILGYNMLDNGPWLKATYSQVNFLIGSILHYVINITQSQAWHWLEHLFCCHITLWLTKSLQNVSAKNHNSGPGSSIYKQVHGSPRPCCGLAQNAQRWRSAKVIHVKQCPSMQPINLILDWKYQTFHECSIKELYFSLSSPLSLSKSPPFPILSSSQDNITGQKC